MDLQSLSLAFQTMPLLGSERITLQYNSVYPDRQLSVSAWLFG